MQRNYSLITYVYHFFSEAIITFLFMIPIMHYIYEWIPYWRYVGLIVIACCLLFIGSDKLNRPLRMGAVTPILIALLLWSGFPVVMSILFPILLIWRYIDIVKSPILNRENTYVKITLLFAIVYVFIIRDIQIIFYIFGLFIILIFGYIVGHIMHMNKLQRKHVNYKAFTYTTLIMIGVALVTFYSYDAIKWVTVKVWLAFSQVMVWLGDIGMRLMEMGNFKFPDVQIEENTTEIDGDIDRSPTKHLASESFMKGDTMTYIYIAFMIILSVFIFRFIYRLVKRQQVIDIPEHSDTVSFADLADDGIKKQSLFKRMMTRYGNKPNHIVRKMVYTLERKTKRQEQGRLPFETIDSWLTRMDIHADMSVYEKVRYGNEHIRNSEIEAFKEEVKKIEIQLNHKDKESKQDPGY